MFRAIIAACFAFSLVFLVNAAAAQDKDKEKKEETEKDKKGDKDQTKDPNDEKIAGKSIGEWIKILRTHEEIRFRRAALIALEAGAAAGRTGLSAVLNAAEKDKEPQVRLEAIQLLGRLGPA